MTAGFGWMDDAACLGKADLFFGPDGETVAVHGNRVAAAKAVCRRCPVGAQCREFARTLGQLSGVWDGTDTDRHSWRMQGVAA